MHFHFSQAHQSDFDRLFALRLLTMRESLERIGRFDPQRALERIPKSVKRFSEQDARKNKELERFQNSFRPQHTRLIIVKDQLAGCVALGPHEDDWLLEHFYIAPQFQGHGLDSLALSSLMTQADQAQKTITLSVLQQSDAARFYERHGFHKTGEDEWDIYYARIPVISRES